MRKITGILAVLPVHALAHEGMHFNPHGGEIVLGLIVALGGLVLLWVRR